MWLNTKNKSVYFPTLFIDIQSHINEKSKIEVTGNARLRDVEVNVARDKAQLVSRSQDDVHDDGCVSVSFLIQQSGH